MAFTNPLQGHPDAKSLRRAAGDYLKKLRESRVISQLQVANAVGFRAYTTVSQIEIGKTRLPPDKLEAWADAIGADRRAFTKQLLQFYDPHTYAALFGAPRTGNAKA